jgi:LysR family transcriptional activator of nhaA
VLKNLNHQHLYYFWHTVREKSMLAASKATGVTQPTISSQIADLERALGKPLFVRHGKSIEPSEFGLVVARYAEAIFSISNELLDVAQGRLQSAPTRIAVGVVDVVPKSTCFRILKPLADEAKAGKTVLVVSEGALEDLVNEIGARNLDFVIADSPISPQSRHRVFSRKLGSLQVWIAAEPKLARALRKNFPQSIHNQPMLFPKKDTQLRRELDLWFHENAIDPQRVGVFDDSALMKQFGMDGMGVVPVAGVPKEESGLEPIGVLEGVSQSFFLIFPERRQDHPSLKILHQQALKVFNQK